MSCLHAYLLHHIEQSVRDRAETIGRNERRAPPAGSAAAVSRRQLRHGGVQTVRGHGGDAVHLRGSGAVVQGGVHRRHEPPGLRRLQAGRCHHCARPRRHRGQQEEDEGDDGPPWNDRLLLGLRRLSRRGDGESVLVLPRGASGLVVDGNGHDQLDSRHHLRHGSISRAREGGREEAEEPGQDLWHGRLRERRHVHGLLQGPEAGAGRRPARSPAPLAVAGGRQVGGGRALPRRQQLLLVALAHPAGAHLQVVRGPAGAVGVDVPPVHAAVRAARRLPPAGSRRLEDPVALRALLLPLLGRVGVRRHVLPAVVVHLGEGPALLRHVQPALHRDHHRVRRRRPPRRAARRQLAGRDRRHRGAVRGAVGQGRRRQDGRRDGACRAALGRRFGEDVVGRRRRQWYHRAPPGERRSNGEVEGEFCSSVFCTCVRRVSGSSLCYWRSAVPSNFCRVH